MKDNQLDMHFRTLGVGHGASAKELKNKYRLLIKRWHPDRFHHDARLQKLAEEKMKDINQAYRDLAEYYEINGSLTRPGPASPERPPQAPFQATPSVSIRTPVKPNAVLTRTAAAVAVLALASGAWLLTDEGGDNSPSGDSMSIPALPNLADEPEQVLFTEGSPIGEVYAIQGVPTRVEGDTWHYGASKVHFIKGVVSKWENHPDQPLRAATMFPTAQATQQARTADTSLERTRRAATAPMPTVFSIGSSKEDVRMVQGAPSQERDATWDYGVSKVYFRGDRVSGWHESPLNPLKVRKH